MIGVAMFKLYRNIDKFNLTLIIAILIHLLVSIWFVVNMPIYTDWAMYIAVIRKLIETGRIPNHFPLYGHVGFPRFMHMTVNYPPLYLILAGMLFPYMGEKTGAWLEIISSSLAMFVLYKIFSKIYSKRVSVISITLCGLAFGSIFAGWDQDLLIVVPELLVILTYLKYRERPKFSLLILISIFSAAIIGLKQSSYFFLFSMMFGILMASLYLKKSYDELKKFTIAIFLVIIFAFPVVYYQISLTGTLTTQSPYGWPIVDKYIFHPKYLHIEEWQKEIDKLVNFEKLKKKGDQYYYEKYGSVSLLKKDPLKYLNEQFSIHYVCKALPLALREIPIPALFTFLYALGFIIFILKVNRQSSILLLILFGNILVLLITSKSEYFLVGPFLWTVFPSLALCEIHRRVNKLTFILLLLIIISTSTVTMVNTLYKSTEYTQKYVKEETQIEEVGKWIEKQSSKDEIIMEVHPSFPYYSNRSSFWDYRLFFINDKNTLLYYLYKYYRPKYVVIYDFQIVSSEKWRNWWHIPDNSTFLKLLKDDKTFVEVYRGKKVHLYEFILRK